VGGLGRLVFCFGLVFCVLGVCLGGVGRVFVFFVFFGGWVWVFFLRLVGLIFGLGFWWVGFFCLGNVFSLFVFGLVLGFLFRVKCFGFSGLLLGFVFV